MNPEISVLMSVYNGEKYLSEAVDSILSQSFRDFEFIVIDDGSTDRSKRILEKYAAKDPRIRLVSRENRGISKSANEGLALARGEFIARMDADDVSLPGRFVEQVAFLKKNPDYVAVGCGVMVTDCDLRPLGLRWELLDHPTIESELLSGNGGALTQPSTMIRKSALLQIGGYDERLPNAEDLDIFIRLSEIGLLANLESVLLLYRKHPASDNHTRHGTWQATKSLIIRETIERRGAASFTKALFSKPETWTYSTKDIDWYHIALAGGQLRTAWHYALRALAKSPGRLEAIEALCSITQQLAFRTLRTMYGRLKNL
jgi:glycosyltransferase involved in cell wall biosynthesis